jgi:hypothetical protein
LYDGNCEPDSDRDRKENLVLWVLVEQLKDTDRTEGMGIMKDNIKMYFIEQNCVDCIHLESSELAADCSIFGKGYAA